MATNGTRDDAQAGQEQAKPLYEIIRDELIADIDSGKYPVGALLPSIRDMSVRWTVSTTTARRVLSELVNAGYARPEGTRGHTALRPTREAAAGTPEASALPGSPPGAGRPHDKDLVERLEQWLDRLAIDAETIRRPTRTQSESAVPILRTAQVVTTQGVVHASPASVNVRNEPAPPDVAMALQLPDHATPVLVRRRVTSDTQGSPVQYRASYISPRIATKNTPLASSDVIAEPWHEALATCTGGAIKVAESYVSARHPSDTEAAMLALPLVACVLIRVDRTVDENDQPVDCTVTVWPGDSTRIQIPSG